MSASKKLLAPLDQDNPLASPAINENPKLFVAMGRGNVGKSVLLRWLVERAMSAGRDVRVADADRTNGALGAYFAGVFRPEHTDDDYLTDWLGGLIEGQAQARMSVVIDMGGGDLVWSRFSRSLELVALLESSGIQPVCVHMVGPSPDDLLPAQENRATGAFVPASTMLVLNAGLVKDTRVPDAAFAGVRACEAYRGELAAGAVEVVMPKLGCMHSVDEGRLTFARAETSLGLTKGQMVRIWRREMEKAFAPVSAWLP